MSFRLMFISAAIVLAIAVNVRADDFYEQQLQIGKIDFSAGRTVQASDEFRIAAFGFLDRPPLLVEALARLALAQSTLGQTSLVTQTLGRFIDVEQRFDVYPAALDSATRAKFEPLLLNNVQPSTLKAIPGLSKLMKSAIDAASELPPQQRIAAYEAGARREPKNVDWPLALMHLYAASGEQGPIAVWAQKVLALDPKNSEARALLVHAYESRGSCRDALPVFATMSAADLQARPETYADAGVCFAEAGRIADAKAAFAKAPDSTKNRSDVRKAIETIARREASASAPATEARTADAPPRATPQSRPQSTAVTKQELKRRSADALAQARALVQDGKAADALNQLRVALQSDPENRQLRLAILEAAVLSKEWPMAAAQVTATMPYSSGEEMSMFYAGVALYQIGKLPEAKSLMQHARPRLPSTPLVDFYMDAVLGQR